MPAIEVFHVAGIASGRIERPQSLAETPTHCLDCSIQDKWQGMKLPRSLQATQ